jgi:predicted GNAT family N-acyltransferase
MMEQRIVKGIENAPEARLIRQAVFVDEQGFKNEFDDIDSTAYHGILTENGSPVAVGRLFTENGDYHIGRIAVMKPYRGKGLGREIVSLLESKISELGGGTAVLSAQIRVKGFYEAMGYTAYGDEYFDEYCPHISMKKIIK